MFALLLFHVCEYYLSRPWYVDFFIIILLFVHTCRWVGQNQLKFNYFSLKLQ